MVLKLIYSLFVGILLAIFVGVGVQVFYPAPEAPAYPNELMRYQGPEGSEDPAYQEKMQEYNQLSDAHYEEMRSYNRNVSIIAVASALVILTLSLTLVSQLGIIADGLLLGGVFTLLYGMVRGFNTDDSRFQFVVVAVTLAVAIGLGYLKLVNPLEEKSPQE